MDIQHFIVFDAEGTCLTQQLTSQTDAPTTVEPVGEPDEQNLRHKDAYDQQSAFHFLLEAVFVVEFREFLLNNVTISAGQFLTRCILPQGIIVGDAVDDGLTCHDVSGQLAFINIDRVTKELQTMP